MLTYPQWKRQRIYRAIVLSAFCGVWLAVIIVWGMSR